jgi:hypothetical protein
MWKQEMQALRQGKITPNWRGRSSYSSSGMKIIITPGCIDFAGKTGDFPGTEPPKKPK